MATDLTSFWFLLLYVVAFAGLLYWLNNRFPPKHRSDEQILGDELHAEREAKSQRNDEGG